MEAPESAEVLLSGLPEPHRSLARLLRGVASIADGLAWPVRNFVLRVCDELGSRLCQEIESLFDKKPMPKKQLTKKEIAELKRDREHIEAIQESLNEDSNELRRLHIAYMGKAQYCNHKLPGGKTAVRVKTCDCGNKHKLCTICGVDIEAEQHRLSHPPSPLMGAFAVPVAALEGFLPPEVVEQLKSQMSGAAKPTLNPEPQNPLKSWPNARN